MGSMRRFDSVGGSAAAGGGGGRAMGHRRAMTLPQNVLDERGLPAAPPLLGASPNLGVDQHEVVGAHFSLPLLLKPCV